MMTVAMTTATVTTGEMIVAMTTDIAATIETVATMIVTMTTGNDLMNVTMVIGNIIAETIEVITVGASEYCDKKLHFYFFGL